MTSKKIYSPLVLEHTEEIEDWLEELHIWECVTHLESKKHGPAIIYGHVQKKKVALRDIAEIEKSQTFVLFENEASYEDFFPTSVSSHVMDTLCNIFSQNLI